MCGRIVWRFDVVLQQWVKSFVEDEAVYDAMSQDPALAEDRYNINPGSHIPVARRTADGPVVEVRKWAFPLEGRYIFNTRIETAFSSPMWRAPIRDGRCVVPVSGFYEWRGSGKARAPFYIHRSDGQPLLLAGVSGWREHRGEDTPCVSIVTCPPNELMARLHDRMPVVLEPDAVDAWLGPFDTGRLAGVAAPAGDVLAAYPVSPRVGDTNNDGPELIRPLPTLGDPLA